MCYLPFDNVCADSDMNGVMQAQPIYGQEEALRLLITTNLRKKK